MEPQIVSALIAPLLLKQMIIKVNKKHPKADNVGTE